MGFILDFLRTSKELTVFSAQVTFIVAKELALLGPEVTSITASCVCPELNPILSYVGLPVVNSNPKISKPRELIAVNDSLLLTTTEPHELLEDQLVETVVDEGKKTNIVRSRRVKKKQEFASIIAAAAKNHFGGVPTNCKANAKSVMVYLVSKCKDHKLTDLQTREVSSKAFCLTFTPDANDQFVYEFLNSSDAWERRQDYLKSQQVDPAWLNLLKKPWGRKAWKRVLCKFLGYNDQEAYRFVK